MKTLALYRYFQLREKSGNNKLDVLQFHLKAMVDDVINRVFGTNSTALQKEEEEKAPPTEPKADTWAEF